MARREDLLVAAQAGVHRIAHRVENDGIGQAEMDHPDFGIIIRHLVGDVLRPRAVAAQRLDIGRTQLAEIFVGRLGRLAWLEDPVGAALEITLIGPSHLHHRLMHDLDLAGAMDLGVAGEDLLDEGAAGARHAEDEDRQAGGIAHAGIALEEGLIEDMLHLGRSPGEILQCLVGRHLPRHLAEGDDHLGRRFAVDPGQGLVQHIVAPLQMQEGLVRLALRLVDIAQRDPGRGAVIGQIIADDCRLQSRAFFGTHAARIKTHELVERAIVRGVQRQASVNGRSRLVLAAQDFERLAQLAQHHPQIRLQGKRRLEGLDGLGMPAEMGVSEAEKIEGIVDLGLELGGALDQPGRLLEIAALHLDHAQNMHGHGVVRGQTQGLLHDLARLMEAIFQQQLLGIGAIGTDESEPAGIEGLRRGTGRAACHDRALA